MKNIFGALLLTVLVTIVSVAQKSSDVLENGIRVDKGNKIFFSYDEKKIKYDIKNADPNFLTLKDSSIFLIMDEGVNVYLRPLNPLNYSYKAENKIVIDQIDQDQEKAFIAIFDQIKKVIPNGPGASEGEKKGDVCKDFQGIVDALNSIQGLLKDDQKNAVNKEFANLKSLTFLDEVPTYVR